MEMMANSSVTIKSGRKNPAEIAIKINLKMINSIAALRRYLSLLVQEEYEKCLTEGLIPNKGGSSKKILREYDVILEAGDLFRKLDSKRLKGKGVYRKIADQLYPNDLDRRGAETKASQKVKEYNKLVSGGWREIQFP